MKRILSLFIILVLMLSTLASCNLFPTPEPEPTTPVQPVVEADIAEAVKLLDDMYEERRSRSDKNDKYDIYNPKYVLLRFGRDDLVGLTKEQYYSLCCTAPTEVVEIYIARLEQLIRKSIEKGMDYSIHSHYRVIKKWMEEDLGEA
jgi:hypothetical protein